MGHLIASGLVFCARSISVLLGLFVLGFLISGDALLPVLLGLNALPALAILGCVFLVASLVLQLWRSAFALALSVTAVFGMLLWPIITRPTLPPPGQHGDRISVVSMSNRTLNQDMAATAKFVLSLDADLILMQEIADPAHLLNLLHARAPGQISACFHANYVIASRHRVEQAIIRRTWGTGCPVALPGGTVLALNVHLPRPLPKPEQQARVLAKLQGDIRRSPVPLIVAGDFNAAPWTTPILAMEQFMDNAFAKAGWGLGLTFPTSARRLGTFGPFMQIDHIFHDSAFQTLEAEVLKNHTPLADHYPVKAILFRPREPAT